MVLDPTSPDFHEALFQQEDWRYTPYSDAKEAIPSNAEEVRGLGFKINANVDFNHAGDKTTRRSRTGYIAGLNSSPIYFCTKQQGGIETSTFGSELIATKQYCEYIRGLRYKLRMMRIYIDGPAYILGDNKSVLINSSVPTSVLRKTSNSIAFHFVCEGSTTHEWRVAYLNTQDNVADLLTKTMSNGKKRQSFIEMIFHYVF